MNLAPSISQILIAFATALVISFLAWRMGSLSQSGAFAALVLGTLTMGIGLRFGGPAVLLGFFISGSLLSKRTAKLRPESANIAAKSGPRDAWQVLANGGVAGLSYLLLAFTGELIFAITAAGSLAAANADTWATELGAFSRQLPRSLRNGKLVDRGSSGAVSTIGLISSAGGALLIAFLYVLTSMYYPSPLRLLGLLTLSGFLGALWDSILGATVQSVYFCPVCGSETEKHPRHSCGNSTLHMRGLTFMTNDWVNFLCTLSGAIFSALFAYLWL